MALPYLNKTCDNKKVMQNLNKLNFVAFAIVTIIVTSLLNKHQPLANISFGRLLLASDNVNRQN